MSRKYREMSNKIAFNWAIEQEINQVCNEMK